MRLEHLVLIAVCVWLIRLIAREVRPVVAEDMAVIRAGFHAALGHELVCVTSGCHTTATDLVETPAGRILPRCGRCAEEMEARGMTV